MSMVMLQIIAAGIGACIVFDLWQRVFAVFSGIPPSNWGMVGRWMLGLLGGRGLIARDLAARPAHPNEAVAGWILHYVVAVGYAVLYALLMQAGWLGAGLVDGLVFGVISVVVPWFFFMPAMGNGMMARRTPNPPLACAMALVMHAVFGLALGGGFALLAG
ncbi:MAG: DUF2938 family protein [Pseudomonadota bacterium]|nr:DUF2938 family protein [Pseudomonadota bacterium]